MSKVPYKVLSTGALAAALSVSAVSVPAFANAADVSYGDVHFDELEAISNSELANIKSIGSSHSDYSTYFNDEGNFKKLPTSVEVNNKNVDYNALADKMSASGAKNINEFIEQGNELPTSELQVESVSAITPTSVEVTFDGEVADFDRNDVTVAAGNGDREFVSSVELAEDGQSATLNLYNELTDETTYDVTINAGEETLTDSFDYLVGDIAEISVQDQVIKPGQATEIDYTITTTTGLDVTEVTEPTINTTTGTVANGTIKLPNNGDTAFVTISAGEVTSDRFTVTANASEATEFSAYNVGNVADWGAEDFEVDHDIAIGDSSQELDVQFFDQYGEKASNSNVTYESLTPSVLIVDETSGQLTPRAEGTADVRVTNGDVSEIVTIEVVAAAEFAGLAFDHNNLEDGSLTLNSAVDGSADVTVQLQDQYDDDFSGSEPLTVEVAGDSIELASGSSEITTTSGTEDITLNAVDGEFGTSTVTVSNDDGSISKSFEVNVVEAGTITGYSLEGVQELDLYANDDNDKNTTNHETTVKVFPVDKNGVKVAGATEADWKLYDEDGNQVGSKVSGSASVTVGEGSNIDITKTGTYTLEATVGSLVVATETIEVANTEAPFEVSQTQSDLELNSQDDLFTKIKEIIEVTQDGEVKDNIQSFDVISNNKSVANDGGATSFTLQSDEDVLEVVGGSATLTIEKVTLNGGKEIAVDDLRITTTVNSSVSATHTAAGDDNVDKIDLTFTEEVSETGDLADQFKVTLGGEPLSVTNATYGTEDEAGVAFNGTSTVSVYVYGYDEGQEELTIDFTNNNYFSYGDSNHVDAFSVNIDTEEEVTVDVYDAE
ncbi:Ig-like domain-containing protein [Lentibacillus cibarius]|uniref:BIG2 domain-containing protein n=1 Tax=Lentibacillus cibarius TaxID=2583219 RepID=A0A5S3QN78_9BACI|nr:hypothetical protein [Lentibacillus cibarius]TMN21946.1 hypothetical protein FFL34_07310 [Lentibacillus cibarius]